MLEELGEIERDLADPFYLYFELIIHFSEILCEEGSRAFNIVSLRSGRVVVGQVGASFEDSRCGLSPKLAMNGVVGGGGADELESAGGDPHGPKDDILIGIFDSRREGSCVRERLLLGRVI